MISAAKFGILSARRFHRNTKNKNIKESSKT